MFSKSELIRIAILQWGATTMDDGRLHIRFICDGTAYFEQYALNMLHALGCTDVRSETGHIKPVKGEPWKNWYVDASGVYPGEFPKEVPEQNFEESASYRFLQHVAEKEIENFRGSEWWSRSVGNGT